MNTIIEKIRAEVERLKVDYLNRSYTFVPKAMQDLLDFLSDLEKEEKPSEGLEEEIDRLWESFADEMEGPHNLFDIYARLARHFAKWGAEHAKEEMMKEAVDVQVVGEQRDLRLIDSTQRCLFNANRGDWLKIIIVKED